MLGLTQSILRTNGALYISQNRPDLVFKIGLISKCVIVAGFVIGLQWGIEGVATGYAIASVLIIYPETYFSCKLVDMTPWELCRNLLGIFFCAATMAVFTYGLGMLLPVDWPRWAFLATMVPFGIVVYIIAILVSKQKAYYDVKTLLKEQLSNWRHARAENDDSDSDEPGIT